MRGSGAKKASETKKASGTKKAQASLVVEFGGFKASATVSGFERRNGNMHQVRHNGDAKGTQRHSEAQREAETPSVRGESGGVPAAASDEESKWCLATMCRTPSVWL